MKLSVPLVPVYYFEMTPRGPRLVYHLPLEKLSQLVHQGKVRKEALLDFPYGLEMEVSEEEYRLVREEYCFSPPIQPKQIWDAFRGFWLHSRHVIGLTGIIDARRLETYARQASKALATLTGAKTVESAQQRQGEFPTATEAERSGLWGEKRDQVLRQMPPKDANPELTLDAQKWSRVRMSAGLSAELVFSTAQSPGRRG